MTSTKGEAGPTMSAHDVINYYEMEFDLDKPYVPIEEGVIVMLDERDDSTNNEPIEKADSVQIGDVVVDTIGFKDVETALATS